LECRNYACVRVSGSGADEDGCDREGQACGTPPAPALILIKQVRNVTNNTALAESVEATPGQTVEFSLRISSIGTSAVTSVTVRDSLPAGLAYVAGSTTIDGVAAADGIIGSGLGLGDMAAGRTITVTFRATVAASSFFSSGTTTLINTAFARGTNAPEVSDVAYVLVRKGGSGGSVTMTLVKSGHNLSREQTQDVSVIAASPGELLTFTVRVRNSSSSRLTNVTVRDIAPAEVVMDPASVRVNGLPQPGPLFFNAGINVGTLESGQEAVVTFDGSVVAAAQLPIGTTTAINRAQATADQVPMLVDELPIRIYRPGSPGEVPAGPGESTVLALIVSAIITLLYVGYTSTETYRRREAGALSEELHEDIDFLNTKK
jgi:uncharacterized repeat protein (TIGR01451 family)